MNSKETDHKETIESIIYEFDKRTLDRIKDIVGQKLFQVNKKTGKIASSLVSSLLSPLQDAVPFLPESLTSQIPDSYYIVLNSNFVHRATHLSETISVQDKNGRKIDLSIRCEISCQPGNEERVAKALLLNGNKPEYNLNLFLKKCVYRFQEDIENFISNFYNSNLPAQIEKFIMDQKDPSDPSAHIIGLTFHSVECFQINKAAKVMNGYFDYKKISVTEKSWTSFKAIITKDMREFVITGSFSVIKDDLSFIHIKKGQEITVENIRDKIVETLEKDLIIRYLASTEEFEKVTRDLLVETVSEAYGVLIKIQNIRAQVTDLSPKDKAIVEKIRELESKKIELIASGRDPERLESFNERIRLLEEYRENNARNLKGQIIPFIQSREIKFPEIDDIQFQPEFDSQEFQTSLRLLAEANELCQTAIDKLRKNNLFDSDNAIQHLQALLPELFCCRNLSESFAAAINAIQNALFNNQGQPLSEEKLLALKTILSKIGNQPFMKYDDVIDVISDFEEAGFIIEPQGYEILTELLNE